jgi:hypothetical protein
VKSLRQLLREDPHAYVDALSKMTDYESELVSVGRNDAPELLWSLWRWDLIPHEEFRRLLPDVWGMAEYPTSCIGTRLWLKMFKNSGFVTDCGAAPPTAPLRLYRGHEKAYMRGFSWTTDIERARWFADRFRIELKRKTFIFVATVPPHAVLARLAGRQEAEVVVNPYCLQGGASPDVFEVRSQV